MLRKVLFLAARRRTDPRDAVLVKVAERLRPGMTVAEAEEASKLDQSGPGCAAVAALAGLLVVADLARRLSGKSLITPG